MRAARLKPQDVAVRNNLGVAYTRALLFDEAVVALKGALELDANSPAVHSNLAEAHYFQSDFAGAEAHLRKALGLDPERTADANALRRVVLMRAMVSARCAADSMPGAGELRKALGERFASEGWTASFRADMDALIADKSAMALLQRGISRCEKPAEK